MIESYKRQKLPEVNIGDIVTYHGNSIDNIIKAHKYFLVVGKKKGGFTGKMMAEIRGLDQTKTQTLFNAFIENLKHADPNE